MIEKYKLEGLAIPFFKIDCEGCEYAVIPSFTDEECASSSFLTAALTATLS